MPTTLDGSIQANAVAIQPDGKIVLAGVAGSGTLIGFPGPNTDTFAVVRLNPDGSLTPPSTATAASPWPSASAAGPMLCRCNPTARLCSPSRRTVETSRRRG